MPAGTRLFPRAELRELGGFRGPLPPGSLLAGGGCGTRMAVLGTDGEKQLPESSGLNYFSCTSLHQKAPSPVPVCLSEGLIPCPSVPLQGFSASPGAGWGPGEQGAGTGLFLLPHLWRSGLEITAVIFTGHWKETLSQPGKSKGINKAISSRVCSHRGSSWSCWSLAHPQGSQVN